MKYSIVKTTLLPIFAIAILATLAFAFRSPDRQSTIKNDMVPVAKNAQNWNYTGSGNTESDFKNALNWQQGNGSGCGTSGSRPCQITVNATNSDELQEYFDNMPSSQSVLDLDISKRP